MDKGCKTCAHAGTPTYKSPCSECVASGTFSGWTLIDAELAQTAEDMKPDNVNHPSHYTSGCGFECIEMMEMVFGKEAVHDFCTLNAFKYLWRHKQKNGTEDIAKAEWYLKYARKLTEGGLRQHLTAIDKMTDHIAKLKGEATK